MTILALTNLRFVIILSLILGLLWVTSGRAVAQIQLPHRAQISQVNDFAKVVDEPTKAKLGNLLVNLRQQTGMTLTVAIVQTTAGQEIFEFSRNLARDWDTGARTSASKSLLLVIAVVEKSFFTQFSKKAQDALPEGVLGNMNQRMRPEIQDGRFSEGLLLGIQNFVTAIGQNAVDKGKQVEASEKVAPVPGSNPIKRSADAGVNVATTVKNSFPESAHASTKEVSVPSRNDAATADIALMGSYKVGINDILDIRVGNATTNRSTLYSVSDGGIIDFPLAGGQMIVAGLTTEEIQTRLLTELKRRAVQEGPQVTVGVRQYASHTIIVTGLVSSPGKKVLRREAVPLYVIIAEVQPRADGSRATIISENGASLTVDLTDAASMNALVRSGDVINVTTRPPQFYYIGGRINYPGQKVFQTGITLLQAVMAAGGPIRDSGKIVELSREGANGLLSTSKFNLKEIKSGNMPDLRLQPGDRIELLP